MIDLYTWTTPNGRKPVILLEELALPYRIVPIAIGEGAQKEPGYLALNPNGKIPALVDGAGTPEEIRLFESGAILVHLAEKHRRFLAAGGQARADALGWLFFQVGGVGPMFGQLGHFAGKKAEQPYGFDRYRAEVVRLTEVLDRRLANVEYLAGDYSVADMATYPWVAALPRFDMKLDDVPHLKRWVDALAARPAVAKAMNLKLP